MNVEKHFHTLRLSIMNKLLWVISVTFLLASNSLQAATWKIIMDNNVATKYIDNSSITNLGNSVVRIKTLLSFKHRATPTLSVVQISDFECGKNTMRMVRSDSYSERYGLGNHLNSAFPETFGYEPGKFYKIEQHDDVLRHQYDLACHR